MWKVEEKDRFHKILREKVPNAKKTVTMVDENADIKFLLERRLRGLSATLQDVREVGQMLRTAR